MRDLLEPTTREALVVDPAHDARLIVIDDAADPVYRNCSVPKLSTSETSDPWILPGEPIPPAPAASPDEVRELHDRVVAANRLRVPACVSLATSGALLLGFLFAEERVSMWDGRLQADVFASTVHGIDPHYLHDLHRLSTWNEVRYTMFGGMI